MRAGSRAAAVAAVVLAACGGADAERRPAAAGPELRIWAPNLVRWETGRTRRIDFAIENPTSRTVAMAAPDPANARVDLYAGPGSLRVCGVAPVARAARGRRILLEPGDRVAVRVDLDEACGELPAGEYRVEVGYRAAEPERSPPAASGVRTFSGTLPVQYGQVLVSAPPASGEAWSRRGSEAAPPARAPARKGRAPPR